MILIYYKIKPQHNSFLKVDNLFLTLKVATALPELNTHISCLVLYLALFGFILFMVFGFINSAMILWNIYNNDFGRLNLLYSGRQSNYGVFYRRALIGNCSNNQIGRRYYSTNNSQKLVGNISNEKISYKSLFVKENIFYVIVLFIIIGFIIYLFWDNIIVFFFSFFSSFVIYLFIKNNYNYSQYFIIKYYQKGLIYMFFSFISVLSLGFIFYYFDLWNIIFCQGDDILNTSHSTINESNSNINKEYNTVKDGEIIFTSKEVLDKVSYTILELGKETIPNIIEGVATAAGAGSAAAATVGKVFSSTSSMPMTGRIITTAAAAGVVAASVSGAVKGVNAIYKNNKVLDAINTSKILNSKVKEDSIPSPIDDNFIKSPIESSEITSPLEDLINLQYIFNILIFIIIILMIIIGLNWYINKYNINLITKLFGDRFANILPAGWVTFREKVNTFNNSLYVTLFLINVVVLIFIICFQLYISYELSNNLEDYIEVHNFINKSKFPPFSDVPTIKK